jgi:Domain of unknown function (DUF4350)
VITRRRVVIAAAVVGLAALVLLTPRTADPDATDALRRYLENLGLDVRDGEALPPDGGTLVLLADVRAPDDLQPILEWVEAGGHLVVTDPNSAIVTMVGAAPGATVGFAGTSELAPGCVAPAVVGVERIVVRANDGVLSSDDPAMIACFPVDGGALLLAREYGEGSVTLLGGPGALTNAQLREADNAALAARLTGRGGVVVFGPPVAAGSTGVGVWDALSDGGRAAIVAIVAAAVAFALVRARRLGRPAVEEPIAPIPGSELVRAAGRMYRRARATAYAGGLMRRATASRLSRRLGASGGHDLSGALARASGLPPERVDEILAGSEPRNDDELMELGAALESLSARAEMGSR